MIYTEKIVSAIDLKVEIINDSNVLISLFRELTLNKTYFGQRLNNKQIAFIVDEFINNPKLKRVVKNLLSEFELQIFLLMLHNLHRSIISFL